MAGIKAIHAIDTKTLANPLMKNDTRTHNDYPRQIRRLQWKTEDSNQKQDARFPCLAGSCFL
jgi:hypothetical protein